MPCQLPNAYKNTHLPDFGYDQTIGITSAVFTFSLLQDLSQLTLLAWALN